HLCAIGSVGEATGLTEPRAHETEAAKIGLGRLSLERAAEGGVEQALLSEQRDVLDAGALRVLELCARERKQPLVAKALHRAREEAVVVIEEGQRERIH